MELLDGAQLVTSTLGQGNAGNITLNIRGLINVEGFNLLFNAKPSGIFTDVDSVAIGNGGEIYITAEKLNILNQGQIVASTFGQGNAGRIVLDVQEETTLSDLSVVSTRVGDNSSGKKGGINITANELNILNDSGLTTSSSGTGDAGDITLDIQETVTLDNDSNIFSRIRENGKGGGGNVMLTSNHLNVFNGSSISTSSFGVGDAGDVILDINGTAHFSGASPTNGSSSGAFSSNQRSIGNGGNLHITANILEVIDGSILNAESIDLGNSGNIFIEAHQQLYVNDGTISTVALFTEGGSIQIETNRLLLDNGDITTFIIFGDGDGGNIDIFASSIIAFNDSDILAFSAGGRGGNITLNTPAFFGEDFRPTPQLSTLQELLMLNGNNRVDVNATGRLSSGSITIPDVSFIEDSLNELSGDLVNTDTLTVGSCIDSSGAVEGSFVVTGSGGLLQQPGGETISAYPTGTIQTIPELTTTQTIQEPEGVFQLTDGRIVLSQECD